MRNQYELSLPGEFLDEIGIAVDIGIVQRGLDFIEEAERGRLHAQNREGQRNGRQDLLPAGEQIDVLEFLARGLHVDVDAARQDIAFGQNQLGCAAVEELMERILEITG
ncbi:hypothetical protein SDC9_212200 [bioreactor metagenome]|uniref:Uncharacterized protein n=1 Tax=bioreactor metagenome TaxID=1076179 RepID=A0A645JL78_9ZZZZ